MVVRSSSFGIGPDAFHIILVERADADADADENKEDPSSMRSAIAPDQLDQIRRNIIRLALEQQLLHRI